MRLERKSFFYAWFERVVDRVSDRTRHDEVPDTLSLKHGAELIVPSGGSTMSDQRYGIMRSVAIAAGRIQNCTGGAQGRPATAATR